ncbi:MAG: protein translocase subunit SecD, partial [Verrucomicrobia bacterium]
MNRNLSLKFIFIVLVVAWSFYEMYPPKSRDLITVFTERAVRQDDAFKKVVDQARELQKANPDHSFSNLRQAIGDTPITNYFPFFETGGEQFPTTFILNRLQRESAGKIKLGLDLQGGTAFLVEMDTTKLSNTNDITGALSQAVEVLRRRVDRFGVAEPIIQPEGADRIRIQLPGLSEDVKESAKNTIQRAAFLEFRMVDPKSDEYIRDGEVPPGCELLVRKERQRNGSERLEQVIVKKKAERGLNGSAIKSAMVVRGNLGEPQISFTMNSEGAAIFAEITKENIGRRLAIVLDGKLYSAPVIQGEIPTGNGQITGQFDLREAFELANVLENPLKTPLRVIQSNDVDPGLGKDSIKSGVKASLIGVAAVAGFMLVYYMLAGMIANIALITNIIILIGVMCSVGTTFTLPGIAGIVLTVGMAVDANVLIYERIREELAKGKSLRGAVAAGYDRAFSTIFDSHVTTLISSIILIFMGTGSVKGFGVALTIGVAASLFTALVVTRLIFDFLLQRNLIKSLPMLHIIRTTKLDFMKLAKPAFVASWLLILIGNAYGLHRGKDVLGVEFSGGDTITLALDQNHIVDEKDLRTSIAKTGVGDVLIGYQQDVDKSERSLRITVRGISEKADATASTDEKVITQLKADFKDANFTVRSVDHVGPTVGVELRNTAIVAALIAMFGILVYVAFRYEFSFAVGAVIAIIH